MEGAELAREAAADRLVYEAAAGRFLGPSGPAPAPAQAPCSHCPGESGGPFHDSDPERELEQVRVLVEAPVALTSAFLPAMVRRGRGAILNVASTAGMQPLPYSAGYSAAKAYVLTFSEAVHQEVSGSGVTVTVLAPGPVSTEFWDIAGWEVAGGQSFEKAVPRQAWVTAEQVAEAGVKGLEAGRRVVVPGLPIRAAMLATQYVPHAFKLPAIEWAMRRR